MSRPKRIGGFFSQSMRIKWLSRNEVEMKKYKVVFTIFGVEFMSQECIAETADILIKKISKFGIHNSRKIEVAKTF